MMGDVRYVDLGLGMHRAKCSVHSDFRLIVIAEDRDVYEKFPIPLINRLEKHYLGMETMLDDGELTLAFFSWSSLKDAAPFVRNFSSLNDISS